MPDTAELVDQILRELVSDVWGGTIEPASEEVAVAIKERIERSRNEILEVFS